MKADLTAIVVNWNAGERLACCVRALREGPDAVAVIVVDNASKDDSLAALYGLPGVRIVQTGENLGYGRGANRGIALAATEFVAVLNPDLVMAPEALRRMSAFLDADPARVLVGPRLRNESGRARATCGNRPGLGGAICCKFLLHLIFPRLTLNRYRPRAPTRVAWVTGACMVARRTALTAIGGFDEAIFMYYEDVDLCLRLGEAGGQVWYLPDVEGRHEGGRSSRQALERMLLESERSYLTFTEKHLGRGASRILAAMTPVEMGLRTLLWGAVFVGFPARRPEAASRLRAYRKIFGQAPQGTITDAPRGPKSGV